MTENVYPDALNRLDHTVGDTSTTMTYDALGRIATWEAYGNSTNVNDYTTRQPGCTYYSNAQPHAVRGAKQGSWPPSSFCYDANGNMTQVSSNGTVDGSYTWMSFNQPNKITAPTLNSSSQFLYDQNHQRYKQLASYSGSSETTEYIGGLMELMTNASGTAYRYYVPAGNNFIVYNRWTNGTNALDYVTQDHLGSSAVITDKNGALVVKEKFSALGWNENTTAELATMAGITRHEYTGQEGLNNAGLGMVNMNGRIYIPSGSFFLSPDPILQDPSDTQDYNRYSYARNNALTFVDPSGFDCGFPASGDIFGEGIGICAPPDFPPPDICIECLFPGGPPGPYPGPGPGFPGAPQLQPVVVKGPRWSPPVQPSLPPPDLQSVSFMPNNIPGIALPQSLFQQQHSAACSGALARLATLGQAASTAGTYFSRIGVGLVAAAGLGVLAAPEAFPAEAGLADIGADVLGIGGGFSAVGGALQGYAKAGVVGAVATGGLLFAIDNLSGSLAKFGFPGVDEASQSAVSSILSQIPDALVEARAACE